MTGLRAGNGRTNKGMGTARLMGDVMRPAPLPVKAPTRRASSKRARRGLWFFERPEILAPCMRTLGPHIAAGMIGGPALAGLLPSPHSLPQRGTVIAGR